VVAELPVVEGEVSHREDAVVLEAVVFLVDVADRGVASLPEVAAVVASLLAVDEVAPLPGAEAAFENHTASGISG